MGNKIKEVLKYGVMAPSGDNSQPWRFVLHNDLLEIYNIPDKDNPVLNFMQSGSLIAHGALIKNIQIASSNFNLYPEISIFPKGGDSDLVASILFKNIDHSINPHQLFSFLEKRSTNRRFYENKKLREEDMNFLISSEDNNDIFFNFIKTDKEKTEAARAASSAEVVILENDLLHEYLFKDVMWTGKQEKKERHGLYIKTMEFNPVQKFLFRLAGNKKIIRIARMINFPKFIASEDTKLYASGAFLGALSIKDFTKENFIKVGMRMQEIWLKATSLGLSFQPICAILFLGNKKLFEKDKFNAISEKHGALVDFHYKQIVNVFGIKDCFPLMMFRIGYAKDPSARSSRKEPVIDTN